MSKFLIAIDLKNHVGRRLACILLVFFIVAGTVFFFVRVLQQNLTMRRTISHQLALQSETALETNPQLSLLLAIEAMNTTKQYNGSWVQSAEQALRTALG
jgi:hypothetical protein